MSIFLEFFIYPLGRCLPVVKVAENKKTEEEIRNIAMKLDTAISVLKMRSERIETQMKNQREVIRIKSKTKSTIEILREVRQYKILEKERNDMDRMSEFVQKERRELDKSWTHAQVGEILKGVLDNYDRFDHNKNEKIFDRLESKNDTLQETAESVEGAVARGNLLDDEDLQETYNEMIKEFKLEEENQTGYPITYKKIPPDDANNNSVNPAFVSELIGKPTTKYKIPQTVKVHKTVKTKEPTLPNSDALELEIHN